jgi:cytochrome c-type biogenesis protein CcmF
MTAEFGQVLLICGLFVSLLLGLLPLIGAHNGNARLMRIGLHASLMQLGLVAAAFALLVWAFIAQDFSVEYVARNSSSRLPLQYRVTAVWGAHEGSQLLWVLILSLWTAAVALFWAYWDGSVPDSCFSLSSHPILSVA